MSEQRDNGGPDPDELPEHAGPEAPRPADPSGLGRPLVEGVDVAGERERPDQARAPRRSPRTPAKKKAKPGPATKAVKGVRRKSTLGPRGRQVARVGKAERGKKRTAALAPARRKAVNPRAKSKPVKGSPKAKRRMANRGKRA